MLTINNENWRKYRLWVVVVRIVLMGIPVVTTAIFEWLFGKSENMLIWLDRKLPDPKKLKT